MIAGDEGARETAGGRIDRAGAEPRGQQTGGAGWRVAVLAALVWAADTMLWTVGDPGLGFAVLALGLALVAQAAAGRPSHGALRVGWPIFLLSLLPMIEAAGPLSLLLLLLGLAQLAAWIALGAGGRAARVLRLLPLLPLRGLMQEGADLAALARQGARGMARDAALRSLRDWLPALALGLVFLGLIGLANPLVERWIDRLTLWDAALLPHPGRLVFWAILAVLLWPLLRLTLLPRPERPGPERPAAPARFLSERAVARALVTFNALFAVQTAMDLAYLWGGLTLPEGMTHAEYAHRGAYPLVVTALLAGAFALLAAPHLGARRDLRLLLLVWVGQNLLLVLSSLLRLDLYVDAYGLTRLRFAAAVWMGLVAAGLGLMLWQIATRRGPGWMIARAAALGVVTLWAVSLVNVDGLVARYDLRRFGPEADLAYLCTLSEGAVPTLAAHAVEPGKSALDRCAEIQRRAPRIATPHDWREWGFRNWRLRHSLAAITAGQGPGAGETE